MATMVRVIMEEQVVPKAKKTKVEMVDREVHKLTTMVVKVVTTLRL